MIFVSIYLQIQLYYESEDGIEFHGGSIYDRVGTLILNIGSGVNINSLEYDDAGMIRKLKYGDNGADYEFEYDGEGRIVKISIWG